MKKSFAIKCKKITIKHLDFTQKKPLNFRTFLIQTFVAAMFNLSMVHVP